jgi:hypothetical protein
MSSSKHRNRNTVRLPEVTGINLGERAPPTSPGHMPFEVLVLSIDLGTTHSSTSYMVVTRTIPSKGRVQNKIRRGARIIEDWPDAPEHGQKYVPTTMIYRHDGVLLKWGFSAVETQDSLDVHSPFLVNCPKLGLRDPAKCEAHYDFDENLSELARTLGKTPEDFVKDFFRAIYTYVILDRTNSPIRGSLTTDFDECYIEVVVAVPGGWDRSEHDKIADAAMQFGLLRPQVFVVSEIGSLVREWLLTEHSVHPESFDVIQRTILKYNR